MGSKKEKQIERSKDIITEALLDLLKSHAMSSITITQLCQRAGVGRPTFYRHFESKQDVLAQLNQKWFREYLQIAREAYEKNPNAETLELVAFDFLKNNKSIPELIKSKDFYKTGVTELGISRRKVEKEFQIFDDESPYELEYRVGGLMFVFARWLASGMKESPEDMAKVLARIYSGMRMKSEAEQG